MRKIRSQSCIVIQNKRLGRSGDYFSLRVADFRCARRIYPGSFVHVKVIDTIDPLFRRAFSIADFNPKSGELEIIYKVMGRGTLIRTQKTKGNRLDLIGPLGNRFGPISKNRTVVIVAGGVGFPPLYFLARHLVDKGHDPGRVLFFYGGRTRNDLVEMSRIRRLGVDFIPCTDDGTYGFHGFVTEAVDRRLERLDRESVFICGCGPEPMLAVLQEMAVAQGYAGEISLEAPMPCGVGVCLGCIKSTIANPAKYVRVCHDGPVFKLGEVRI
jgi:dihydroorotate dehydrogenase electron transfer subunit